ncbi:MAG: hypothetical protein RLY14_2721, partial [Planctomycetota bacterium]
SVTADVNPNPGEGSSAATIDESSLEPRGAEATLDIAVPVGSDSASKLSQETLDVGQGPSSSGSPFKTDEIRKIWEKAAGSSGDPAHSLAKGPVQVSDSVFERISTRNLNLNPNVKTANADYHIKAELGRGKQGIVYAAQQKGLDRTVAIKLVRKDKSSSSEREKLNRFVREAEITASLDHPNILPIHEIAVTSEGELFYSMKRVQGKSWDDILDEKKETLDESVEHLLKVCDAIAFAHSKGIIHRDLKPGNVMIGGFGEVLVADWGMAVDVSNSANFKPTEEKREPFSFGGTPAYMSPEMAKHDWRKIGPASDIYLLGAILYHLIEGKPPRDGRTVFDVLEGAKNNSVIKPKEMGGLMAVALKAMSASTTDRYKTATEMQDAIREVNRHAESMRLANRSAKLLEEAIAESDYEKFNGAIFGYRDALNLWRDNKAAEVGVNKARMAYAENAFSRGDFDVCLDALDPENPAEKELYSKAEKAQAEAKNRERRYRSLRRYSAIGAVVALGGLSLLTLRLQSTNGKLEVQTGLAQTEAANAREQEKKAKEEAGKARAAEADANTQKEKAEAAKILADMEAANARNAENNARMEELKAKEAAEKEKKAKDVANQKTLEAIRNERIATLGSYQARLLSAYSLAESLSIGRSNALLAEIEQLQNRLQQKPDVATEVNPDAAKVKWSSPPLKTWPFGRVAMMNNQDVPQLDWRKSTGGIDAAVDAPIAVVGSKQGTDSQLQLISLSPDSMSEMVNKSLKVDRDITSVAISPNGQDVVYLLKGSDTPQPGFFYWNTATGQAEPVIEVDNRDFRWVAYSPDGKYLLVGINQAVYRWNVNSAFDPKDRNVTKYPCRGKLLNIQFVEVGNELKKAFCTSEISATTAGTTILVCYELDLGSDETLVLEFPEELKSIVSTATVVDDAGTVLAGTSDGRLLRFSRGEIKRKSISLNLIDELPRVHQTKILKIRPNKNSQLLTIAQDSAIQLWQAKGGTSGPMEWVYERPLLGLTDIAVDAKFVGDGERVVAVDQSGRVVEWNLKDQALRARMSSPQSFAGMVAVGGSGSSGPNWWIDRAGVLTQWEGKKSSDSFAGDFVGHTPESEFVDAIYSPQSNRVVTVTRLGDYASDYRTEAEFQVEFCVWDTQSGKMLNRWRHPSTKTPRLSFVSEGKKIVAANSDSAFVANLDGTEFTEIKEGGNSILAFDIVGHPINPNQFVLLGDLGEVWMVSLEGDTPRVVKNVSLAFKDSNKLLKGCWSPEGDLLYLLRSKALDRDPTVVSFELKEGELVNNKKVINFDNVGPLSKFEVSDTKRKAPNHIVDMAVRRDPSGMDKVYFVIRYDLALKEQNKRVPAISGVITWDPNGKEESTLTVSTHEKKVWLGEQLDVIDGEELITKYGIARKAAIKLQNIGGESFLGVVNLGGSTGDLTTNFQVFYLDSDGAGKRVLKNFGRTVTVDATADSDSNNWVTVHSQGELWLGKRGQDNEVLWSRLG